MVLTSIKVPPLKSIPRFKPFILNKTIEIYIAKIEKIKKFLLKPKKLILGSTGIILFKPNIIVLIPFYLKMISINILKNL